jgi:hypothetical protein
MTKRELQTLIMNKAGFTGMPGMKRAHNIILLAVQSIGRLSGVPWGRVDVTFATISGTAKYELGVDIIDEYPDLRGIEQIWRTDTTNREVNIWSLSRFNSFKRGSTTTGAPEIATIYSDDKFLEFYPIPDAVYTLWAYVRKGIFSLSDIPDNFLEIVAWRGVMMATKAGSPAYLEAKNMFDDVYKSATRESATQWSGDVITPMYVIGATGRKRRTFDSGNKLGLG